MRLRPIAITAVAALALTLGWPSAAFAAAPTVSFFTIDNTPLTASISMGALTLKADDTSAVTITFSEPVVGFNNADLAIENGTLSVLSSSDDMMWMATFAPANNVEAPTNVISFNLAGVTDYFGNPGVGWTSISYAIDTKRPTATIELDKSLLGIGETTTATITFSEEVVGFTAADLIVAGGTPSGLTQTADPVMWTFTLTPTAGFNGSGSIGLAPGSFTDGFGNSGSGAAATFTTDSTRPTASISMSDSELTAGETSTVTIIFSEAVTHFDNSDLSIANGTLSDVASGDGGMTWTATFTPTGGISDPTNLIVLNLTGVRDLAGNFGAGVKSSPNYTIDTMRPTATISVAPSALAVGLTATVTVTFSEAVTGFDNADLTIENGALSAVASSDGGVTWTATFTPTANVSDRTNVITLALTAVTNASGNTGVGTMSSNNYAIDTARPTATIVVADSALGIGETSTVTIAFSEAVTGFDVSQLSVANGTLSNLTTSDGITWIATLTPTAGIDDNTNLIMLDLGGLMDAFGNVGSSIGISNNYRIDHLRPTATIDLAKKALTAGETSPVTVTFSEAVVGFDNADLTIENGALSAVASSDGGVTWTATFTPATDVSDSTNVITLDLAGVRDVAGNPGVGGETSVNYAVDTVRPTASIVVSDSSLTAGETSRVTVTFSEAVVDFDNADLTVENGALSAVASSDGGVTWTATFTPATDVSDSTNVITLGLAGVRDVAGNAGVGSAVSNSYSVAAAPLALVVTVSDTTLGAGETSLVTFRFSRAVVGFSNANVTVTDGALSPVTSADGGVTFTATFTPAQNTRSTGNVISVNLAGVTDAFGASAGGAVVVSNSFAVATAPVPEKTPTPEETPAAPTETSGLASTGTDASGVLAAGALLVLLGAAVSVARRRATRA
ncbi:Ig-like domain-containing protein [Microterricola viridarii]|uniref:Bacterial Ig-like domain-containing protein n=1 Tax=Microterricola viridarii TaxID=412690 RepID=A0A0X8E2Q8_9MICO|nr:Ig-like domain-containing protein [Microterricola viridarii]AMB59395.1 hypothetical protein AWU67_11590 [Microterricola viridarii]